MKLSYVAVNGFRGYQKPVRFEFADGFTVVDGRNGAGKSTIFDAVEFALTGTISKYLDAKSSGESIDDYVWWKGTSPASEERYVEVGFAIDSKVIPVRRTPADEAAIGIQPVLPHLVDQKNAPSSAIEQLCAATIIRDEHISRLSLDLKEGDRFTLLRDAIGAIDADAWTQRGAELAKAARNRLSAAEREADQANGALASAAQQLDQARADIPPSAAVEEAYARLTAQLGDLQHENLLRSGGDRLAELLNRSGMIQSLIGRVRGVEYTASLIPELEAKLAKTAEEHAEAKRIHDQRVTELVDSTGSHEIAQRAHDLATLASLGHAVGRRDGHCPLCDSELPLSSFEEGVAAALSLARTLDKQAAERAIQERALEQAKQRLSASDQALQSAERDLSTARSIVESIEAELASRGLAGFAVPQLEEEVSKLNATHASLSTDIRLVQSVGLQQVVIRATSTHSAAQEAVGRAQAKLGRARLADGRARALHDAARRAAGETLDLRLNRVLPLLSELYRRLRPHPRWEDIEYSVRGDVMRFLKLQVGGGINPQFVFSSGQRRATGLAFLLSINLSIAWNRWRSILLDDPVQHVDDFRTVHLAEVLAQLCSGGRQIICAVEDSALADLMCRRLPSTANAPGKRISLGHDAKGCIDIVDERALGPGGGRYVAGVQQATGD